MKRIMNFLRRFHEDERGEVDLSRLGWLALGAGSTGVVSGMISGAAPEGLGLSDEIVAGVVGFMLANQKGRRISPIGEGMLIAAAGAAAREPIEKLFNRLGKKGNNNPAADNPAKTTEKAPATVDGYIASKYGV